MSKAKTERDDWVNRYAIGRNKALLTRLRAPGETGTDGDRGRRHMTDAAADTLLVLVESSGVGSTDGRRYLIDVLRWHYGYSNGAAPVAPLGKLTSADATFIRNRAYELVRSRVVVGNPIVRDRVAT